MLFYCSFSWFPNFLLIFMISTFFAHFYDFQIFFDSELSKCEVGEFTIFVILASALNYNVHVTICQALMLQQMYLKIFFVFSRRYRWVHSEIDQELLIVYNPESLKLRLTCDNITNLTSAKRLMFHYSCDLNAVHFQVAGTICHFCFSFFHKSNFFYKFQLYLLYSSSYSCL